MISKINDGLNVVGEIKLNEQENVLSYEKILATIHYLPKKNILEKLNEIKKSLFVQNSTSELKKGVTIHAN